ncbi:rhomboid family intramembrane serine protease [Histophilus somni]|uniref:GlpG protein, Rhomboid family n=1 Tax=Histophilus somni (strain 129Pt) TaxID=205914 RepID=Q0I0W0_HISS1|nr:rhomboid family intramembrane serine protease [Histophilus somni]
MKLLFGSERENFIIWFRDYIRAKYLLELTIQNYIDEKYNRSVRGVFIEENHPLLTQLEQEKILFLQDPFNPCYQQAAWEAGDTHSIQYKKTSWVAIWKISSKWFQQGKITLFITALCTLIYVLQNLGFEQGIFHFTHYPANPAQQTEIWRYISHSLVHLSPLHFLFNLSWFWLFGGAIERQLNAKKLLLLFFVSSILTGVVQNYFSDYRFFGLSGVVYAVLGYVFILDKFHYAKFALPSGFFLMLIMGIALGFISPLVGIYMGNSAHISGLLCGILLGLWQVKKGRFEN